MGKSGWPDWAKGSEGFTDARGAGRYTRSSRHVPDHRADKLLTGKGNDPQAVVDYLNSEGELGRMSPQEQDKVVRRVNARAAKRGVRAKAKLPKNIKRGGRGNEGMYSDSQGY